MLGWIGRAEVSDCGFGAWIGAQRDVNSDSAGKEYLECEGFGLLLCISIIGLELWVLCLGGEGFIGSGASSIWGSLSAIVLLGV